MLDGAGGGGNSCGGCEGRPPSNGSASNSQLKLSKKPNRSVVSDCEKRSAEEGIGIGGGGGKNSEMDGSKVNSKSANGAGG